MSVAITGRRYDQLPSHRLGRPISPETNATYTTATTTYYQVITATSDSLEVIEDIVIKQQMIASGRWHQHFECFTGGAGTMISYQWQSSSSATGPFADIAGATNATYTTDALTSTTYYQVIM
ncbi:MAG: hypothetical protein R2828_04520 [Saprospiraceae bacterium]